MAYGRKDFVKVAMDVPVRYKFLSKTFPVSDKDVHEGFTSNLSGSGLILTVKIPDGETLIHLLTNEIVIGLNMLLPSQDEAIKALAVVEWVDALPEMPGKCGLGVRFVDMPKECSDQILRYTIRAQITKKVHRGET
jgi:hypothetical protein